MEPHRGEGFYGTLFKMTPAGAVTTLDTLPLGESPDAALVEGNDGNFYRTTSGYSRGYGTIFRISPAGGFTTLYTFMGGADGGNPSGALIEAMDGNFCGTTYSMAGPTTPATTDAARFFRMTPDGAPTTLYNFDKADGSNASGALVQATDGDLYGTTETGGAYGRVLGPFVKSLPMSGSVGSPIRILSTDLNGATSVTLNGTPATFTVVQPSEIVAEVPAGATLAHDPSGHVRRHTSE
jgi:uncharacterized repeat protein (TIGR03803 family)